MRQRGDGRKEQVRRWAPSAAIVGGLAMGYALLPLTGPHRAWGAAVGILLVLAPVPVVVRRVRAILGSPEPFQEALAAVVVVSTLIVIGPASTYYGLATSRSEFEGLSTKIDALYFTMSVVSTVGFGDVRPVGQGARLVTTLHIIFTIVVAGGSLRLLSWAARQRLGEDHGPSTPGP